MASLDSFSSLLFVHGGFHLLLPWRVSSFSLSSTPELVLYPKREERGKCEEADLRRHRRLPPRQRHRRLSTSTRGVGDQDGDGEVSDIVACPHILFLIAFLLAPEMKSGDKVKAKADSRGNDQEAGGPALNSEAGEFGRCKVDLDRMKS